MAEASNLEEIAKTAPETKTEEKPKQVGTLESVFKETSHLGKTALNLGLGGLSVFGQAALFPHLARDTYILSSAQLAADATIAYKKGQKFTSGKVLEAVALGATVTAPLYYVFNAVDRIPLNGLLGYVEKAAVWGGLAYPAYIGLYQVADYLIRNKKISGLGKYLKENYWPTLKKSWKYLLPISLLNVFFAPPILHIPIAAGLSYLFALFGAPKKGELKEEEKRDKTPYLVVASSALGKGAKTVFYGVPQAFYAIGSGLKDTLYKSIPKPVATSPAHT